MLHFSTTCNRKLGNAIIFLYKFCHFYDVISHDVHTHSKSILQHCSSGHFNCVSEHKISPAGSEEGNLPLSDLSNTNEHPKQQASKNAETSMSKTLKVYAPRGIPLRIQSIKQKQSLTTKRVNYTGQISTEECDTLQSIINK